MAKYFESKAIFHFHWDQVAQAFWQRYPNPHSTHVLSEDVVFREIRGNKLFSKRLLSKTNRVPKWGERFISSRTVKIVEESVIDPKEKVLTTYTRNLGYVRVMSVIEKVVYKVSEENANWTVAHRSAWIDSQLFGFGRAIKAFGIERFKKNCNQMIGGFNYVLHAMFPRNDTPNKSSENFSQHSSLAVSQKKEALKDAAKRAKDLAKAKAGPIYASCQAQT